MTWSKGFKTGLGVLLVGCVLALILFAKDIALSVRLHNRHARFVTSSGRPLITLFEDVPPNAKFREMAMHPRASRGAACKQNTGFLPRIMNALGLGTVVHAQPTCNTSACRECFVDVDVITCSECGLPGYYTDHWDEDPTAPYNRGYLVNGQTNSCTYDGCFCPLDECTNSNCTL
jgi:hypothetical protein